MKHIDGHIIFLTQFFYPEVNATAQLLTELAVELRKMGVDITTYTNRNIYLEEKRPPKHEIHRGVLIIRLASLQLDKDQKIQRIVDSLLFFLSCLAHLTFGGHRTPLFICTNPPFLPIVGWLQKKLRGRKYAMLLYDIHPEMSVRLGWLKSDGFIARLWDFINQRVYHDADVIITIGRDMKRIVDRKLKFNTAKVKIIHNWADGGFIRPIPKAENWFCQKHGLRDKFVVLYSGTIGIHHELESLIRAAARCQHLKDITFLFIGEGAQKKKLVELAQELCLNNVQFLPYQPKEVLPYSLTCGDLSVITMKKGMEGLLVSCKIYTTLASGIPALALSKEGCEVAEIIRESGCGFRVDQDDVMGIVKVLEYAYENRDLLNEMSRRGREYFESRFDKKRSVSKYYEVLSELFWT